MKSFLHWFSKTFVDSYLWISAGAVLLAFQSVYSFGVYFSPALIAVVFGGSVAIYNFHRWYKPEGLDFKSKKLVWIALSACFAAAGLFDLEHFSPLIILVAAGLISLFYIVPFQTKRQSEAKSFRERHGFKLWMIAIAWVLMTVNLPLHWAADSNIPLKTEILLSLERFCFIAGITIPFDIRDVYTDDKNLRTFPQRLGLRNSKLLALILLVLSAIFAAVLFNEAVYKLSTFLALFLGFMLSALLILKSREELPKWYYSVVMDGLTLAIPLLILLFNQF